MKRLSARRKAEIEQLVKDHLQLVEPIARRVGARLPISVELDDMIQEGRIGLMQAAQRFDPAAGVPFHQYAQFRIRGAILDKFRRRNYTYELHAEVPDERRIQDAEVIPTAMIDPSPGPDVLIDEQRKLRRLSQARALLPKRQQAALTMWSDGCAYREIAAKYGRSMNWAFKFVQSAQANLREQMKRAG